MVWANAANMTLKLMLILTSSLWLASTECGNQAGKTSKYPPAEPGALGCEPLKAARTGRCRGPQILSLRSPAALIEDLTNSQSQ
jgi:hypothetical protein